MILFLFFIDTTKTITTKNKKHKYRRAWATQNINYNCKYVRAMLPKMRALWLEARMPQSRGRH